MDNKVFGTTFILIISSALLFFGIANAGAAATDKWIFPTEKFGDHTYIGTANVSNMEVASAMAQFSETTQAWRDSSELLVTYQDATAPYPLDNAEILLEETAAQAQSGTQNSFVYQLQADTTASFLAEHFPVVEFSTAQAEEITTKLELALESGLPQTHVAISDDSLGMDRSTISELVLPWESQGDSAAAVIQAISEIQIGPGEQFSFLDLINELEIADVTDGELTKIASAIYGAVLKTNFSIEERSIGTSVPKAIPVGQEAAINRSLGVDLAFTNPNASTVILNTAIANGSLAATLTGFPLVYDYAIQTGGKETVKPRIIKQYSAFVPSGKVVDEEGSEGVRIQVTRSTMSEGEELEVKTVSTDFYPPVHRVEVYALAAPPVESVPVDGETAANPDSTDNTDGALGEPGTTGEESAVGGNGGDSGSPADGLPAGENPTDEPDSSGNANSGTPSNSENDSKPNEPIYDKGGNLVNP